MDRKKIFIIWWFGCLAVMLITSCLSMVVWNYTYQPEAGINLKPISHISGMIFQVPVGWLLSFTTPFGWASIVFMGISVYMKLPNFLIGSAIATVLSGIWWPKIYVIMLQLNP